MHPLAAHTVRQAIRGGAKFDALDHYDALAALDAAARASDSLPLWHDTDLLDCPEVVGREPTRRSRPAVLYPPTYAALIWIEDHVSDFFGDATLLANLAVAWALAHGRDPEALREAATPRTARRLVKTWAGGLNCGLRPLVAATKRLLETLSADDGQQEENPAKRDAKHVERSASRMMLARLVLEFHQPEEYWLFGSRDRLSAAIELLRRKDRDERAALARAEGKAAARDPDDPETLAFVAWRKASDEFLERFKG